jgi:hypothetical protein
VIPVAGAVLLYVAVLVDSLLYAGNFLPGLSVVALAGAVLIVLALWRGGRGTLGAALLLAGVVYIAALEVHGGGVDGSAPLVATALFLCAELTRWSFDLRVRINGDDVLMVRRAAALTALALGAAGASSVVVSASAIAAPRDLVWTALGAAAAAGAAGMGVWLARR